LIIEVPPGKHTLRSSDDQHGGAEEEFREGQVSFYRVHVEATNAFQVKNFWVLDPVSESKARKEIEKLHPQPRETKSIPPPKGPIQQSRN
jgi:hypothetical protein